MWGMKFTRIVSFNGNNWTLHYLLHQKYLPEGRTCCIAESNQIHLYFIFCFQCKAEDTPENLISEI